MNATGLAAKLRDFYGSDPLTATVFTAALVALATTPVAFAALSRQEWFQARRGRVTQRPEFASVVCGMMLVMGVPAVLLALVAKSRHFDEDRYEFDPNRTWSVLDQGRGYETLKDADAAVKQEMGRLALERKNLVDGVKKLDEAMLSLRTAMTPGTSAAVAKAVPNVLQRLAFIRRSVGVDGPQQLMDETAPPVELAGTRVGTAMTTTVATATGSMTSPASAPSPVAVAAPAAPTVAGLAREQAEAEMATVPAPQKPIAAMLPLTGLPAGWAVGKSGDRYVETFNAENLFEKIDGRAESFVDFKVKGMAYTYYHPEGDESNEVQLYIFELGDTLKALGKYGTEKPDDAKPVALGSEGYTAAGSTLFYSGPYYTQIVSTKDDAVFSEFALALARRIAAAQRPSGAAAGALASAAPEPIPGVGANADGDAAPKPAAPATATPEAIMALLPSGSGRSNATYVPEDVFGYSFLNDVFLADYSEGGASWKGFLRPYATPEAARAVLEKYVAGAKLDGAEVREVPADGADRMVLSSNVGLFDAFFLKGNTLAGLAGGTDAKAAEAFGRSFAKSLPANVPALPAAK